MRRWSAGGGVRGGRGASRLTSAMPMPQVTSDAPALRSVLHRPTLNLQGRATCQHSTTAVKPIFENNVQRFWERQAISTSKQRAWPLGGLAGPAGALTGLGRWRRGPDAQPLSRAGTLRQCASAPGTTTPPAGATGAAETNDPAVRQGRGLPPVCSGGGQILRLLPTPAPASPAKPEPAAHAGAGAGGGTGGGTDGGTGGGTGGGTRGRPGRGQRGGSLASRGPARGRRGLTFPGEASAGRQVTVPTGPPHDAVGRRPWKRPLPRPAGGRRSARAGPPPLRAPARVCRRARCRRAQHRGGLASAGGRASVLGDAQLPQRRGLGRQSNSDPGFGSGLAGGAGSGSQGSLAGSGSHRVPGFRAGGS